ncbi:MAG: helix-turn-helix domain-containing protein [Solirubrobacterales bacterium]
MTRLRERMKTLRQDLGLTQEQLAAQIGVHRGTVANWETGRANPDPVMMGQIADVFRVSVDYLLGRTDRKWVDFSPDLVEIADRTERLTQLQREKLLEFLDLISEDATRFQK